MAGVALSSLRVTSDFDASGYVRGAAQKVAADQQMIAADKARNASLAQADAAMAKIPGGMASVSKSLLDGYGAGAQFEAIVRRIGNAVDRGMGLERANTLLDAAYRKFGLTADAAVLAERGFVSIAGAVRVLNTEYEQLSMAAASAAAAVERASTQAGINQAYGIDVAPSKSAQESADAFLAQYGGLEGVARAKAQEAGAAFSADLDKRMVAGAAKSARDAANVFDAELKRVETIAQQRAEQAGTNFQRSLTEAIGGGGPSATSQGATYSALAEQVARLDAIEQARVAHNAQQFQANINLASGIDRQAKSAKDSAAIFMEMAAAEDRAAAKAAALRASINPLEAEMVKLGKEMAEYRSLLNQGVISSSEFEQANVHAAKRLSDLDMSLRQAGSGGRVLSGELGNMMYQVNDVITGLALGQPVLMIAAQQGGQIYQIFSNSKASITEFAGTVISSLVGMVTPARAAFGAVVAGVGFATAALFSYQGRIQEVQRLLTGMGRGSGATAAGIDAIGQANSSPGGLSTNEARNLAAALAATGKVGVDSIGPIVALGHDFAKTFGVDAKEATEILTKAFADPAKGADELNQRLGFLDANTKLLIESLVTQGNRTEAVRILTEKIKGSIADAADITGFWARVWNTTGNAISNFFDRVGRGADRLFDGGSGLDEKISNLTVKLLELQRTQLESNPLLKMLDDLDSSMGFDSVAKQIAVVSAQIEVLRQRKVSLDKTPSAETRDKQRGMEIDAIARAALPAIDATRKLADESKALNEAFSNPAIGKWVSVVGGDLVLALQRVDAADRAMNGFDPVKNQIADMESQVRLLDRRSPADRAREAATAERRRQQSDPNAGTDEERLRKQGLAALQAAGGQTALDGVERQRIGTLGQMASISDQVKMQQLDLTEAGRQGIVVTLDQRNALLELAREQALGITAMKQQGDATRIQSEALGMSVGAAAEFTAVQSRLAQALRDKQPLTAKDIADIKAQAAALGEVVQAAALAHVRQDIRYGAATGLLSSEDAQIAQQLRGIYPDVATALQSVEASGLRTNQALGEISSSLSNNLASGLTDISTGAKSVSQGFSDMTTDIVRDIERMAIQLTIVQPLMRALQTGFSAIGGGVPLNIIPSAFGNVFPANDNGISRFSNQVVTRPTLFAFAKGAALMGEAGEEAIMPLRRSADGRLGVQAVGGRQFEPTKTEVHIHGTSNPSNVQVQETVDGRGNRRIDVQLDDAVSAALSRPGSSTRKAMGSNFGARPIGVRR